MKPHANSVDSRLCAVAVTNDFKHKPMAGIYVHVPFCHAKCAYCDFYSKPVHAADAEKYVNALTNELAARRNELPEPVKTVYIGGGTPSSLPFRSLLSLMEALPSDGITEYTIEVNPEDVSHIFVDMLKKHTPVNRISMGVQSLRDDELRYIGRRHSAKQAIDAANIIKGAGFSLSLDLIYGLPGQTAGSWQFSLDSLLALTPEHLSCYLLSYEPGTRLNAMRLSGKVTEAPDSLAADMYDILTSATARAGYRHYEISNFALPGHEAVHNSSYWNLTPYLGLGPGAHSFDGHDRSYNPSDLKGYIDASGIGFAIKENETDAERFNDFIITSLRTANGIDLERCRVLFGEDRQRLVSATAGQFVKSGIMWLADGKTGICEKHWLRSDSIMVEFIEV